jgi:hypothetical protein
MTHGFSSLPTCPWHSEGYTYSSYPASMKGLSSLLPTMNNCSSVSASYSVSMKIIIQSPAYYKRLLISLCIILCIYGKDYPVPCIL